MSGRIAGKSTPCHAEGMACGEFSMRMQFIIRKLCACGNIMS
jgi:hypothetical protein